MYSNESNTGTVLFLIMILITVFIWVGAEYFHRSVNKDEIDPIIQSEVSTTLPSTIDTETLNKFYNESNDDLVR